MTDTPFFKTAEKLHFDTSNVRSDNWVQTYSGCKYSLHSSNVLVTDLILGASRECRFAGQISPKFETYCVLEHSFVMHDIAVAEGVKDHKILRTILAHDLPEGILGDVVSPFKRSFGEYTNAEDAIWQALCQRLDLHFILPPYVKDLDNAICIAEKRALLPHDMKWGWEDGVRILHNPGLVFRGYSPSKAREQWINRWNTVSSTQFEIF